MSASQSTNSLDDETKTLFAGQRITLTRDGHEMILESNAWCFLGFRIFAVILFVSALMIGACTLVGLH